MPPFFDSIIVLAIVLAVARFIKRGSGVLQKLFIPSSLVAGVMGLILGPQILGTIPAEVTNYWAQFPKHLINVVFAGLFLGKFIPSPKEIWKTAGPMIAFGSTMAWAQYVVGIGLTMLVLGPLFGASPLTGSLIEISFAGGHGTAAGLAPTFEQLGWSEGTDLALGLATLSIITAVVSGIIIINIRNRKKGHLADAAEWKKQQRQLIRSGYNLIRFGHKFNTQPKGVLVNALAFSVAIGIGWLLLQGLILGEEFILRDLTDIRLFAYIPLFPLAMIGGLIVQLTLRSLNKQHLIQRRTAAIFSAIALDVLIASAIATVSLNVIGDNLATFLILGLSGIGLILGSFFFLAPKMFKTHWFERGLTDMGQAMGMTATGLLMNRLVDPSNKLKIREAFAYKQLPFEMFMGGGIVTATAVVFIHELGPGPVLIVSIFMTLFWLLLGLSLGRRKTRRRTS